MRAYSQDLRERVLSALALHERPTSIARRLEVSRDWVYEVKLRYESTGERSARRQGGCRRSRIAHLEEAIREWIRTQPDLTLAQMCTRLAQQGITLREPALWWHQLHKWGLRFKKRCTPANRRVKMCNRHAANGKAASPCWRKSIWFSWMKPRQTPA